MPNVELPSRAEQQAATAASLKTFARLNLQDVRRDLSSLLAAMQADHTFDSNSQYDFAHIDMMLRQLDWLIPQGTQERMTAADWLLIVLATYFHDLGLLVTPDEFARREHGHFPAFKEQILTARDSSSLDYVAMINSLPQEDAERFLYREYVRSSHPARIRSWIEGQPDSKLGITQQAAARIQRILAPVPPVFMEDLVLICESHHLDDLSDVAKYPVSRPYGPIAEEAANVQYAAVLLRSIDLLNITSDRTPSLPFLTIDRRDPLSQNEWPTRLAVRAVRPKMGVNREGDLDPSVPRDTIEIHALFNQADDFFGFMSYLSYVESDIRHAHDWIAQSDRSLKTNYLFPWQYIDLSSVEAQGFIRRSFEFTIDQGTVLDLLVGHTLYDDSSVVIRELLQNAIDAVRLMQVMHGNGSLANGNIELRWDSHRRLMEILDNGTGMTQEVIESHFLRAGSSYYQTARFRQTYPDFHPISRFGIGILSSFMMADQIEVVTCHTEEPEARRLDLRSAHGRYLVRLLDKDNDNDAARIGPHGTLVRLYLRPSAQLGDLVDWARRWIVVPGCKIVANVDGNDIGEIGYPSVKSALEAAVFSSPSDATSHVSPVRNIRVIQMDSEGLSLAFATQWNDYFREWGFVSESTPDAIRAIGTCVEGVRVQTSPPGIVNAQFSIGKPIMAIANFTGHSAPRANLARSGFEYVDEYDSWLKQIYSLYAKHVTTELEQMQQERNKSLTWMVSQAPYLLQPLIETGRPGSELDTAMSVFGSIPMLLLEEDNIRLAISADELADREFFYTVDGALLEHIEYLLQEIPEDLSFTGLLNNLGSIDLDLPKGPLLCTRLNNMIVEYLITKRWQIAELRGAGGRQRCEAKWVKSGGKTAWSQDLYASHSGRWSSLLGEISDITTNYAPSRHLSIFAAPSFLPITIPIRGVSTIGFDVRYSAAVVGRKRYLLPNNEWPSVVRWHDDVAFEERSPSDAGIEALSLVLGTNDMPLQFLEERIIPLFRRSAISELIDFSKLIQLRRELGWRIFDTWQRQRGAE